MKVADLTTKVTDLTIELAKIYGSHTKVADLTTKLAKIYGSHYKS